MDTSDLKLLQDMLNDIEHLIEKTNQMYIPAKYHTTSLRPEACVTYRIVRVCVTRCTVNDARLSMHLW